MTLVMTKQSLSWTLSPLISRAANRIEAGARLQHQQANDDKTEVPDSDSRPPSQANTTRLTASRSETQLRDPGAFLSACQSVWSRVQR